MYLSARQRSRTDASATAVLEWLSAQECRGTGGHSRVAVRRSRAGGRPRPGSHRRAERPCGRASTCAAGYRCVGARNGTSRAGESPAPHIRRADPTYQTPGNNGGLRWVADRGRCAAVGHGRNHGPGDRLTRPSRRSCADSSAQPTPANNARSRRPGPTRNASGGGCRTTCNGPLFSSTRACEWPLSSRQNQGGSSGGCRPRGAWRAYGCPTR